MRSISPLLLGPPSAHRCSAGSFDEDDLTEIEPPPERPYSREELDALVDEILDEELERLREVEEEMKRPPN